MSNRYSTTGGNHDPYDFEISDELSPESSGSHDVRGGGGGGNRGGSYNNNTSSSSSRHHHHQQQQQQQQQKAGGSSKGGGGGGGRSSTSHFDALSPETPSDSDESYPSRGGAPPGKAGRSSGLTTTAKPLPGSSSSSSSSSAMLNNNTSIEERIAARLARLDSERQLRLGSGSAPGSANTSFANGTGGIGTGGTNSASVSANVSLDNIDTSGLTAASRARNVGNSYASTASTRGGGAAAAAASTSSVNASKRSTASGGGGGGGRPYTNHSHVLGSPVSPGEADSSSSVDLSSGDFQVGAIAARARAARQAAAAVASSGASSVTGGGHSGSFTSTTGNIAENVAAALTRTNSANIYNKNARGSVSGSVRNADDSEELTETSTEDSADLSGEGFHSSAHRGRISGGGGGAGTTTTTTNNNNDKKKGSRHHPQQHKPSTLGRQARAESYDDEDNEGDHDEESDDSNDEDNEESYQTGTDMEDTENSDSARQRRFLRPANQQSPFRSAPPNRNITALSGIDTTTTTSPDRLLLNSSTAEGDTENENAPLAAATAIASATTTTIPATTTELQMPKSVAHLSFADIAMMMKQQAAMARARLLQSTSTNDNFDDAANGSTAATVTDASRNDAQDKSTDHGHRNELNDNKDGYRGMTSSSSSFNHPSSNSFGEFLPGSSNLPLHQVSSNSLHQHLPNVTVNQQSRLPSSITSDIEEGMPPPPPGGVPPPSAYLAGAQLAVMSGAGDTLARTLRAAASAALSRQLQASAAAQESGVAGDETAPSTLLREFANQNEPPSSSKADIIQDDDDIEDEGGDGTDYGKIGSRVAPPLPPPHPRSRSGIPLRADAIRAAVANQGFKLQQKAYQPKGRRSSANSTSSSRRSSNASANGFANSKNVDGVDGATHYNNTNKRKLPIPIRMTHATVVRATISRDYRATTDSRSSSNKLYSATGGEGSGRSSLNGEAHDDDDNDNNDNEEDEDHRAGENEEIQEHAVKERRGRITRQRKSTNRRGYVAVYGEEAARDDDDDDDDHEDDVMFRLVTHDGEFAVGDGLHSPRKLLNNEKNHEDHQQEGDLHDEELVPLSSTLSKSHAKSALVDPGSTHGKAILARARASSSDRIPSPPPPPPFASSAATTLETNLANALIADAVSARYKAEIRINELQSALSVMESKLSQAEAAIAEAAASGPYANNTLTNNNNNNESVVLRPSVSLYALLREAITSLTVHQYISPSTMAAAASSSSHGDATGSNSGSGSAAPYTLKRWLRDRETALANSNGRSNSNGVFRREWAPGAPIGSSNNITNNGLDESTISSPRPTASSSGNNGSTVGYFDEVPVAAAAAASAVDGYRAFVPLELVAALQSELTAQEKMLGAYHADNQRLREDVLNARERAASAEAARAAAAADASATAAAAAAAVHSVTGAGPTTSMIPITTATAALCTSRSRGDIISTDKNNTLQTNIINNSVVALADENNGIANELERVRAELTAVKEDARVRQEELAFEIDRLRKAKIQAECMAAGVDMAAVSADAEEGVKLRKHLADERAAHEREAAALRTKIEWYRDNQAIVDADTAKIAQQAETIRELQAKIWAAQGGITSSNNNNSSNALAGHPSSSPPSPRPSSPRNGSKTTNSITTPEKEVGLASNSTKTSPSSPAGSGKVSPQGSSPLQHMERELVNAQRRIKELESNLTIAQDALSKRHPDSLANLIRESKGAAAAAALENDSPAVLAELHALNAQNAASDEAHDRALRGLRQEHERLRAEYERREVAAKTENSALRVRLAALGDTSPDIGLALMGNGTSPVGGGGGGSGSGIDGEGPNALISKRELALRGKVKELETELERVRAFYQKKVKDDRSSASTLGGVKHAIGGSSSSRNTTPLLPTFQSSVPGGSDDETSSATAKSSHSPGSGKKSPAGANEKRGARSTTTSIVEKGNGTALTAHSVSVALKSSVPKAQSTSSRDPSPNGKANSNNNNALPGSRRDSIASGVSRASSRVSAAKPRVPDVPKLGTSGSNNIRQQSSSNTTSGNNKIVKSSTQKVGTKNNSTPAAPTGSSPSAIGNPSLSSSSSSTASASATAIEESSAAATNHLELLSQIARLEAENTRLRGGGNAINPGATEGDDPKKTDAKNSTAGSASATIALTTTASNTGNTENGGQLLMTAPSAWAAAARAKQDKLQQQVDQLYSAISLLEARAEAREVELARAEHAVQSARDAAAVLMRAQFEDALRAKDDALRAARAEVQELMNALIHMSSVGGNNNGDAGGELVVA